MRIELEFGGDSVPSTEEIQAQIYNCIQTMSNSNDASDVDLIFRCVDFDHCIAIALKDLFHQIAELRARTSTHNRKPIVSEFWIERCQRNQYLDESIESALALDVVEFINFRGQENLIQRQLFRFPAGRHQPLNLKSLCLANVQIDIEILRSGILDPALRRNGGGLDSFCLSNVSFEDDETIKSLSEALAAMSQRRINQDQNETGRFLSQLRLVRCELQDQHLELVIQALMKPKNDIHKISMPHFDEATAHIAIESTLKYLRVAPKTFGHEFFATMGSWLLDTSGDGTNAPSNGFDTSIVPLFQGNPICSCSIEDLQLSCVSIPATEDIVASLTKHLSWSSEYKICDGDKTLHSEQFSIETDVQGRDISGSHIRINTNKTLKKLHLQLGDHEGGDNMGRLGRFVSEHLLALEALHVYDFDFGEGMEPNTFHANLANFANASCSSSAPNTCTPKNMSLRKLLIWGYIDFQLPSMVQLLDRYPMLRNISFLNRNGRQVGYQHLVNQNAAGKFLFSHSRSRMFSPIALWPNILERFQQSLEDDFHSSIHRREVDPLEEFASAVFSLLTPNIGKLVQLPPWQVPLQTKRKANNTKGNRKKVRR